jgi:hypothetical protein
MPRLTCTYKHLNDLILEIFKKMDTENLDDPALGPRTGVELEAQETGCNFKDEDQMIFSVESSSEYTLLYETQ